MLSNHSQHIQLLSPDTSDAVVELQKAADQLESIPLSSEARKTEIDGRFNFFTRFFADRFKGFFVLVVVDSTLLEVDILVFSGGLHIVADFSL